MQKKIARSKLLILLKICVSSLCRGHANLLCIGSIVTDEGLAALINLTPAGIIFSSN